MSYLLLQGDAVHLPLPDRSVDLVFGSPPYIDARTYGIKAQRACQEWIDWMLVAQGLSNPSPIHRRRVASVSLAYSDASRIVIHRDTIRPSRSR